MRSDGRLLDSLPWTIAALLASYAPLASSKPLWISVLLLTSAASRWFIEYRRARLLPGWLRTPIGVLCFVAVLYSYGGINGVGPGSALLSVMAALKLAETRTQRDQFVLMFIALFMILATFLQEQAIWSAAYLLLAFPLTLAAWMAVARDGRPLPARWYLRQTGMTLALATPLLLALWLLFPRVPGPFWAIPTDSGKATVGLSSTMSPGDITSLSESNAVAFRVRFDGMPPAQEDRYWRAIVMQRFDGRSWSAEEPSFTQGARRRIGATSNEVRYTVTMEPTRQRWLFALDMPSTWQGAGIYMSRGFTLQRRRPVNELLAYDVSSALSYRAAPNLSVGARRFYTQLPPTGNDEALAFATAIRNDSASELEFIERILSHFREQPFYYTLSPPALGRDSVDEFLFSSRRGFCEHYASSFAFLARAAGIPARIVAGYQGGQQNSFGDYMIVRQSDAHAWTEVWLRNRGWVRVDPTAAVAPERIEGNLASALRESGERQPGAFDLPIMERLQLAWDMINARWNEWVLGFGPETQRNFFEWLGLDDPDWRDFVVLLTIILVALMGLLTLWLTLRHRPPRPDRATRLYRRMQRLVRVPPRVGEPPLAYAERAGAAQPDLRTQIDTATYHYLRARYAGDSRAAERLPALVRQLGISARSARRRQPAPARGSATRGRQ